MTFSAGGAVSDGVGETAGFAFGPLSPSTTRTLDEIGQARRMNEDFYAYFGTGFTMLAAVDPAIAFTNAEFPVFRLRLSRFRSRADNPSAEPFASGVLEVGSSVYARVSVFTKVPDGPGVGLEGVGGSAFMYSSSVFTSSILTSSSSLLSRTSSFSRSPERSSPPTPSRKPNPRRPIASLRALATSLAEPRTVGLENSFPEEARSSGAVARSCETENEGNSDGDRFSDLTSSVSGRVDGFHCGTRVHI